MNIFDEYMKVRVCLCESTCNGLFTGKNVHMEINVHAKSENISMVICVSAL